MVCTCFRGASSLESSVRWTVVTNLTRIQLHSVSIARRDVKRGLGTRSDANPKASPGESPTRSHTQPIQELRIGREKVWGRR